MRSAHAFASLAHQPSHSSKESQVHVPTRTSWPLLDTAQVARSPSLEHHHAPRKPGFCASSKHVRLDVLPLPCTVRRVAQKVHDMAVQGGETSRDASHVPAALWPRRPRAQWRSLRLFAGSRRQDDSAAGTTLDLIGFAQTQLLRIRCLLRNHWGPFRVLAEFRLPLKWSSKHSRSDCDAGEQPREQRHPRDPSSPAPGGRGLSHKRETTSQTSPRRSISTASRAGPRPENPGSCAARGRGLPRVLLRLVLILAIVSACAVTRDHLLGHSALKDPDRRIRVLQISAVASCVPGPSHLARSPAWCVFPLGAPSS